MVKAPRGFISEPVEEIMRSGQSYTLDDVMMRLPQVVKQKYRGRDGALRTTVKGKLDREVGFGTYESIDGKYRCYSKSELVKHTSAPSVSQEKIADKFGNMVRTLLTSCVCGKVDIETAVSLIKDLR